jgi:Family of unknown function (DUF6232)
MPNVSGERTYLQQGRITITNSRFIVGSQTYAMRGVTSVKGIEITPPRTGPVFLLLVGLLLTLVGLGNTVWALAGIGVLAVALAIWWICKQKSTFAVLLTTAAGELRVFESYSNQEIGNILDALNESIACG